MGKELVVVLGCRGGTCRGCGEVWERCGRVYGVSVEKLVVVLGCRGGTCRGCGEVWERCGRVYGVSVEKLVVVLGCREVVGDVGKYRRGVEECMG